MRGSPALAPARQAIAPERHPFEIRTFALGFARDRLVAPAHAGWGRLIAAKAGAGIVRTHAFAAALAPARAIWIAEGEQAEIAAGHHLDVRIAYVRPCVQRTRAVAMTPLGRELLERCVERGWLDPHDARDARLLAVIADELALLEPERRPAALALPYDARAVRVAEHCTADHARPIATAAELARLVGCSARTLERIFARQTGLGVVAWQRRYRLLVAAAAVGAGASVTDAGFDAGYAGTSAFVTAFRHAFGTTPKRYGSFGA